MMTKEEFYQKQIDVLKVTAADLKINVGTKEFSDLKFLYMEGFFLGILFAVEGVEGIDSNDFLRMNS